MALGQLASQRPAGSMAPKCRIESLSNGEHLLSDCRVVSDEEELIQLSDRVEFSECV